jgi:transketolase
MATGSPTVDHAAIAHAAAGGRLVVTLENHTIIGGLADAVASSLVFNGGGALPKIQRIGLPDEFLGTGALPTLHDRYGLSTDAIVRSVHGWLG